MNLKHDIFYLKKGIYTATQTNEPFLNVIKLNFITKTNYNGHVTS